MPFLVLFATYEKFGLWWFCGKSLHIRKKLWLITDSSHELH